MKAAASVAAFITLRALLPHIQQRRPYNHKS
jgi:hypothetical protein